MSGIASEFGVFLTTKLLQAGISWSAGTFPPVPQFCNRRVRPVSLRNLPTPEASVSVARLPSCDPMVTVGAIRESKRARPLTVIRAVGTALTAQIVNKRLTARKTEVARKQDVLKARALKILRQASRVMMVEWSYSREGEELRVLLERRARKWHKRRARSS